MTEYKLNNKYSWSPIIKIRCVTVPAKNDAHHGEHFPCFQRGIDRRHQSTEREPQSRPHLQHNEKQNETMK